MKLNTDSDWDRSANASLQRNAWKISYNLLGNSKIFEHFIWNEFLIVFFLQTTNENCSQLIWFFYERTNEDWTKLPKNERKSHILKPILFTWITLRKFEYLLSEMCIFGLMCTKIWNTRMTYDRLNAHAFLHVMEMQRKKKWMRVLFKIYFMRLLPFMFSGLIFCYDILLFGVYCV